MDDLETMRVYISGPADKLRFEDAETYLRKIGHTPVNSLNCSTLVARIELLSSCDAIFLLSGWLTSNDSKIEKLAAEATTKETFFESRIDDQNTEESIIFPIKGAIQEVTGLAFEDYAKDSPGKRLHKCESTGYFCRMIFSYQCQKAGIDTKRIPRHISRDYTSIIHYLNNRYNSEYNYNKQFRELADKVDRKLYPEMAACENG